MNRTYNSETAKFLNQEVKVCGWVNSVRAHGKILFVDLRDITGILQIVFVPPSSVSPNSGTLAVKQNKTAYEIAKTVSSEWVIEAVGKILERPAKMVNPKIETGKIEMVASELRVLSSAETPPFSIGGDGYEINEEKRMEYR